MRKGFTLVEMLVIVIVLPFVFILLDGLYATLLADIPRSYRIAQESITLQNVLEQMQQDMDKAKGLTESFTGLTVNEKQFLIELPDGVIDYQRTDSHIIRRWVSHVLPGIQGRVEERTWLLPHTQVEWKIRKKDSMGYAVEVLTHFKYKTRGKWKKTMANSHLFYRGSLR